MQRIFIIFFLFLAVHALGQQSLPGRYVSKSSIQDMFGQYLELNQDSTFVLNYSGDLIRSSFYGKWTTLDGKLLLGIDSIASAYIKYQGILEFYVKDENLYQQPVTKAEYKKLKKKIIYYNKQTKNKFKIPSYSTFKQIAKSFKDNKPDQYLEKRTAN